MTKTIFVFKTNVKNNRDLKTLRPHLNQRIGKLNWNFDLEDCDKILRVESEIENKSVIVNLLESLEFECEELPD